MVLELLKNIRSVVPRAAKNLKEEAEILRSLARAGDMGVVRVTAAHPDKQLAALAKAFDEILESPVITGFIRHKPKLYVVEHGKEIPRIGAVIGANIRGKHVLIDTKTLAGLKLEETQALLAHEIGHYVRLDSHFRSNFWRRMAGMVFPFMEKDADRISVAITRNPQALDNAFHNLQVLHPEAEAGERALKSLYKGSMQEQVSAAGQLADQAMYLPTKERSEFIHEVGREMEPSPSHVIREIRRRLTKEHDRLFGRHR